MQRAPQGQSGRGVVVVGSINLDVILRLPSIPRRGESRLASRVFVGPGGKGANQAAQAAKLGASIELIGRVGTDQPGDVLMAALAQAGVGLGGVRRDGESGLGVVYTDGRGGNWIAVAPRANGKLSPADVRDYEPAIASAAVLLTQLEIPVAAAETAIRIAARHGVTSILNPAPARPVSAAVLRLVSVLVPNETEAEVLSGRPIRGVRSAVAAARELRDRGPERVVITLGRAGLVSAGPEGVIHLPAFRSRRAVDPTGAGDAFCGALAVAIAEGRPWEEALRFGSAAGSLCVQREGALPSLPDRTAVEAVLAGGAVR